MLDVAEDGIVKVARNLIAKGSEMAFILYTLQIYREILKLFSMSNVFLIKKWKGRYKHIIAITLL